MVFVSEVNKTTMQRQNRGDGDATEMRFGSLWTSGHGRGAERRRKNTDLLYSVTTRSTVSTVKVRFTEKESNFSIITV